MNKAVKIELSLTELEMLDRALAMYFKYTLEWDDSLTQYKVSAVSEKINKARDQYIEKFGKD